MEIKKFILILAIIIAVAIPWYIKYTPYFFKKNSKCSKEFSLIEMNANLNKLNICNNDEFNLLVKILSQHLPDLQFVHLLSKEEQYKIYSKLLENYVIDAYAVKEYLNQEGIDKKEEFIKDRDLYLKIMENNFNMNIFHKNILDSIQIDNGIAEKYYEENKQTVFASSPFAKISPGINANAMIIDNDKKDNKNYEVLLLDKKNCIPIENYNPKVNPIGDKILSDSLIDMKIKEYRKITLTSGQKIMLYKISENQGEWHSYNEVSDKVKQILKKKLFEEESIKKIDEIKNKLKIKVSQKNLDEYIEEKNILLKSQYLAIDEAENKILNNELGVNLDSDELVEEQPIKNVEQKVAK